MYAGKIGRGLALLIVSFLFYMLSVFLLFISYYALLFLFIGFVIWLYSIYDAYNVCREHNDLWYGYLEQSGQA